MEWIDKTIEWAGEKVVLMDHVDDNFGHGFVGYVASGDPGADEDIRIIDGRDFEDSVIIIEDEILPYVGNVQNRMCEWWEEGAMWLNDILEPEDDI